MVCCSKTAVYAYVPNFVSIGLFCRPLLAENPTFCRFLSFFGLQHLVMSPIGISLTKLNMGAQLQNFNYPTASKSVPHRLYSNAFMAKSGVQSLTFKSVTNRQKQTDKNLNVFAPPRRRVKPNQTWPSSVKRCRYRSPQISKFAQNCGFWPPEADTMNTFR